MEIELHDPQGRRLGQVEVDVAARPSRVQAPQNDHVLFLTWEAAMDDGGHMRKCVVCGSNDLYREKRFPHVTGLAIVMAFAGLVVSILGYATTWLVLMLMFLVLLLDVAILLMPRTRLVCYKCRSVYSKTPIARYHHTWDAAIAERYAPDKKVNQDQ